MNLHQQVSKLYHIIYCINFSVTFIYLDDENRSNTFHHFSILSGPLLASLAGSVLCLIPVPNVLEKTEYAFLEITLRNLSGGLLHFCQMMIRTVYWSKFTFEKRMKTYALLLGLQIFLLFSVFMIYYYVWIIYLGFAYPLPLCHIIGGSLILIIITISIAFR